MEKEPKPSGNLENQGLPDSQTPSEQLGQQFEVQKKPGDRHRLQLDFSPRTHQQLVEIRKKMGATTNAKVIRNALRIYEWFLDSKERDARLLVVEGSVTREIEILL